MQTYRTALNSDLKGLVTLPKNILIARYMQKMSKTIAKQFKLSSTETSHNS